MIRSSVHCRSRRSWRKRCERARLREGRTVRCLIASEFSLRFRVVLKRLGLDLSLTPYTLRHSSIIRQIRSNVPLRIIAFVHDTSVVEIERTYGRYLSNVHPTT